MIDDALRPGHPNWSSSAHYRQVRSWMDHIGYKPDWTIELDPGAAGSVLTVHFTVRAVDSVSWVREGRAQVSRVELQAPVPYFVQTQEVFVQWVRDRILEIEKHEVDEFFHDPTTHQPYRDPHRSQNGASL